MNETIKKYAPVGAVVVVIIVALLFLRRSPAPAAQGVQLLPAATGGGGADANALAQTQAQLTLGQLGAKAGAFQTMLDYQLGLEKLSSDERVSLAGIDAARRAADDQLASQNAQLQAATTIAGQQLQYQQYAATLAAQVQSQQTAAQATAAKYSGIGGAVNQGLTLLASIFRKR